MKTDLSEKHASVLDIENITFGYRPQHVVLKDFNATLSAGKLCVLLGPNATGKSTLLRLILGLLKPSQGSISSMGMAIDAMSPKQRAAKLAYVPQRAGASFAFSVSQVVAMGRYALSENPAAVEAAMASCDLTAQRDEIYSELSAGQQQRVLLARALAQCGANLLPQKNEITAPRLSGQIMLLDEPVSAMDLRHIHETMHLLTTLAKQGMAVLVVLHDLNLAARYADEIWLMSQGKLTAHGSWKNVLVPEILEPVYRVKLSSMQLIDSDRPQFVVRSDSF